MRACEYTRVRVYMCAYESVCLSMCALQTRHSRCPVSAHDAGKLGLTHSVLLF